MKEILKEDFIYHESWEDWLTKINENFKELNEEKTSENDVENKINEKNFAKKISSENFQCWTPFFKTSDLILGRWADGSTIEWRRNWRALVADSNSLTINYWNDFWNVIIHGEKVTTTPIEVVDYNNSAGIKFTNKKANKTFEVGTNNWWEFYIWSNNESKNYARAKDSWFEFNAQVTTTQTTPLWNHSLVTKWYIDSLLWPNSWMQKVFDSWNLWESASNDDITEFNLNFNISEEDFNSWRYLFYYLVRNWEVMNLYWTFERSGVRWWEIRNYPPYVWITNNWNTVQVKNAYARTNRRLLIFKLF